MQRHWADSTRPCMGRQASLSRAKHRATMRHATKIYWLGSSLLFLVLPAFLQRCAVRALAVPETSRGLHIWYVPVTCLSAVGLPLRRPVEKLFTMKISNLFRQSSISKTTPTAIDRPPFPNVDVCAHLAYDEPALWPRQQSTHHSPNLPGSLSARPDLSTAA